MLDSIYSNYLRELGIAHNLPGPGNLTASLVRHALERAAATAKPDFQLLPEWEVISRTPWPLSYQTDARNWRLWEATRSRPCV